MSEVKTQVKFWPIGFNVLVQQDDAEDKSKGGIIMPDTVKDRPKTGTVLAVGPGDHQNGVFVKTTVKPGQRVIFKNFAGDEILLDGEKYRVMTEDEILGITL